MDSLAKSQKVVVGLVGLPARGKSYISRKVSRYLNWQEIKCEVFNNGEYRRKLVGTSECTAEFFDPENTEGVKAREEIAETCLLDLIKYLKTEGNVAIYDATNSTVKRRQYVRKKLEEEFPKCSLIWVESICDDENIINASIKKVKLSNPDYKGIDPEQAIKDFLNRIDKYKKNYQEVSEENEGDVIDISYMKIMNIGRQVHIHNVRGFLGSKIVSYLMNLHANPNCIYLVPTGESKFLSEDKLGGDSELTDKGRKFAELANEFFKKEIQSGSIDANIKIFTSTLRRALQTASKLNIGVDPLYFSILDELYCGVYEGITKEDFKNKFPQDYKERCANKLTYRYPRGESYLDVIHRLEPLIFEIERSKDHVIVISHQNVMKILYAYFHKEEIKNLPWIDIPRHTIIKLQPGAYFSYETRYQFNVEKGDYIVTENPKPLFADLQIDKQSK